MNKNETQVSNFQFDETSFEDSKQISDYQLVFDQELLSEHSVSQSPLTRQRQHCTTPALRWLNTLPVWVITRVGPSQHPQYSRADYDQEAVEGSLTTSTTTTTR